MEYRGKLVSIYGENVPEELQGNVPLYNIFEWCYANDKENFKVDFKSEEELQAYWDSRGWKICLPKRSNG